MKSSNQLNFDELTPTYISLNPKVFSRITSCKHLRSIQLLQCTFALNQLHRSPPFAKYLVSLFSCRPPAPPTECDNFPGLCLSARFRIISIEHVDVLFYGFKDATNLCYVSKAFGEKNSGKRVQSSQIFFAHIILLAIYNHCDSSILASLEFLKMLNMLFT